MVRADTAAVQRDRRLRVHLTDIHLQPELGAAKGLALCLSHVQSPKQKSDGPSMIITGGDTIMDAFEADRARTTLQWELWRKVKADSCSIEMQSVIGNHDIWGWKKPLPTQRATNRCMASSGPAMSLAATCPTRALIERAGTLFCSTAYFHLKKPTSASSMRRSGSGWKAILQRWRKACP